MAKTKTPKIETRPIETKKSSWSRQAIVLRGMIHGYRISGKVGDVVDIDPDLYDELIEKKFIKAI